MEVAIIGRPNVGKSSIFNRIIGRQKAIVEPTSGVTRDRLTAEVSRSGKSFSLIDTGGFDPCQKDKIGRLVAKQARQAIDQAQVLVLVGDAGTGVTDLDKQVAKLVRKSGKPAVLAVNKTDNETLRLSVGEFFALGLDEPFCVSATQGAGIKELIAEIVDHLPLEDRQETNPAIKIAIVGRPNVGKSSFVNKLLKEERVIVDDIPGTTRDAIDTEFVLDDRYYTLIDTAGIRRKSGKKNNIDYYGFARTQGAIERCDVTLVLIDAAKGLTSEDIRIIGLVLEKNKGCALVLNKWDLVKGVLTQDYEDHLRTRMKFIEYVPMVFISALTGRRIEKAVSLAAEVEENTRFRISTSALNNFWGEIVKKTSPPAIKGRRPKLYYFTQTGIKPPAFLGFTNHPRSIRKSYTSFLENRLRREFNLLGTVIKLSYRTKKGGDNSR